ncbi:hypothetical protein OG562_37160 [Streptomyces sp. NBC_01275]|uniref:hypothetical protein n=1 Tax=Streptomyces sp. NBC_01275 TaxID=2903807 RepID=UPI002257B286|nr:hypothetical protein [Streptomyces sp. NBC_01275]MCX4766506.1 hypothetical protein [Streptomyces sp. NBC_01275]
MAAPLGPSPTSAGRDLPVTAPTLPCAQLAAQDFGRLDDAATSITATAVVAKSASNA